MHTISIVTFRILVLLLVTFTVLFKCTGKKVAIKQVLPVLEFPQTGIDDSTAYHGYTTRFFQDSKGNIVQIILNRNTGRVVNTWADTANESMAFTVRDSSGQPANVNWSSPGIKTIVDGKTRFVQYTLYSEASHLDIGHWLLGSMRVERDFQYRKHHLLPFSANSYTEEELRKLINNIERLPTRVQQHCLALLNAAAVDELRSRLLPQNKVDSNESMTRVLIQQPTFDGKNHLSLELSVDSKQSAVAVSKEKISINSRLNQPILLTITIGTDSPALTPLHRQDIFNQEFQQFYERVKSEYDHLLKSNAAQPDGIKNKQLLRFERLERQVKSIELLSYREKLMAGMPNYATYFGRDMMMSALMLEPIWTSAMLEHVIACVLNKLSPSGEVSHEEALGGQAIRENAAEFNQIIDVYLQYDAQQQFHRADSALSKAEKCLSNLQATRENYRMLDDDFQLPVLVARYLSRSDIPAARKQSFLLANSGPSNSISRLSLLMRNFLNISRLTSAYANQSFATNLVSFQKLDSQHWLSGSWRDSDAGYANGRFAMDINAIWAPKALESIGKILVVLREMGFTTEDLLTLAPEISNSALDTYINDSAALQQAIKSWRNAINHFKVYLSAHQLQPKVRSKLAWLPEKERVYWETIMTQRASDRNPLEFLSLALDETGKPIPVANTDPATLLFLEDFTADILAGKIHYEEVIKFIRVFIVPYPIGLFVEGLGPLVANDAYASPVVWKNFQSDHYHSPRVVWGREVNLLILGLSKQILAAYNSQGEIKSPILEPYLDNLREILSKILTAVETSGLKDNELWSYEIENGKLQPMRYAISCDIQLWNLTNLAVQFFLERISAQ